MRRRRFIRWTTSTPRPRLFGCALELEAGGKERPRSSRAILRRASSSPHPHFVELDVDRRQVFCDWSLVRPICGCHDQ
jgi:hypothetical protein